MAGSAGSIFVDLLLRDANYVAGLRKNRQQTNSWAGQVQKDTGNVGRAFQGVINPVNNISGAIARLSGVIAGAFSVNQIVQYSDTWRQIQGRLSLVAGDMQNIGALQADLAAVAERTRAPLEGVYNFYTRLAQFIPEAERAQYDLLGVTESVAAALAITGETSESASAAMIQFTQAIGTNFEAAGQELRSLQEQAPRLTKALMDALGDGTKSLQQLKEEGLLTRQSVLNALSGMGAEGQKLRAELEKISPTVRQAFTQLNNSFLQYIGQSEAANASTSALALGIRFLADNLDLAANAALAIASVMTARMVPALVSSALSFASATQQSIAYQLALARMAGISSVAATATIALGGALRGLLLVVGGPIGAAFLAAGAAVYYFSTRLSESEKISRQYSEAGGELESLFSKLTYASTENTKAIRARIVALYDEQAAEIAVNKARLASIQGQRQGFIGRASQYVTSEEKSLIETIRAQEEAFRDFQDRALYLNDREIGGGTVAAPKIDMKEAKKQADELSKLYDKNRQAILGVDKATLDYQDSLKELNTLLQAGKINQEEYARALDFIQEKYDEAGEKTKEFGFDLEEFSKEASRNLQDVFKDFFMSADKGFDGLKKGFANALKEMVANAAASNLASILFGNGKTGDDKSGGLLGGLLSKAGSILPNINLGTFGGFFADGGTIGPGQWGIVGEEGPELAFGGQTGKTIIPNKGMQNTYVFNVGEFATQKDISRLQSMVLATAGPGVIEQRVSSAQARGAL